MNALDNSIIKPPEWEKRNFKFTCRHGYWTLPGEESDEADFGAITRWENICEDWYKITPYVAEFWSAVSSVAIIVAGIWQSSPVVILSGIASTGRHLFGRQWLVRAEQMGSVLVMLKVLSKYKAFCREPNLLALPVVFIAVSAWDKNLGRKEGRVWPHVLRNLAAAGLTSYFLDRAVKST